MTTPATRPAPKPSVLSRALRRAIEYCKLMFDREAGLGITPSTLKWREEATEYNALLKKIEPQRKKAAR